MSPGDDAHESGVQVGGTEGVLAEIQHAQLDADALAERLPSIPATPPPQ